MKILNNLFKWFSAKDKNENDINIGYVLEGEPETEEDIKKLFKAYKLEQYIDIIKPLIRPKISIEVTPTEESEFKIGDSKVGGQPDLLNTTEWPKNELRNPLSFIAQINLNEASKFDTSGLLPKEGLVSFFYCANQEVWGFDPKDNQRFKVLYSNKLNELTRTEFPNNLEAHSIYQPNKIKFNSCLSIPTWDDDSIIGVICNEDSDNYSEASYGSENQILGYANCVQGTMELECQLVTNGIYCGDPSGYEDPKRKELEKDKNEWVLLLQVDSDEDKTGMMWGDSGRIYFWIKKQDLKDANFNNVWCILQCY